MKVLFDTNIFIVLETPGEVLPDTLSDMVRIARELHYNICYHPAQTGDLMRDKDAQEARQMPHGPYLHTLGAEAASETPPIYWGFMAKRKGQGVSD